MKRLAFALALTLGAPAFAEAPADTVFRHGAVHTVDSLHPAAQAVAVRGGKIVYVGSDDGAAALIGGKTRIVDLDGRTLMPGLVDGHMHPLAGGAQLRTCNLDYAPLTEEQFRQRIQACLDAEPGAGPDQWLLVSNWYRQFMRPPGTDATKTTLDALKTGRPILVVSSDYHSALVNSRGLELAGVTDATPDPAGGKITRDGKGEATGILEDDARSLAFSKLPPTLPADNDANAAAALDALRRQGVTSFLDAAASPESLDAFTRLQKAGRLTARAHFAPVIDPASPDPAKVIPWLAGLKKRYDQGSLHPAPGITLRNAKMFMDGVVEAPAETAGMLTPYFVQKDGVWQPGEARGEIYFPAAVLKPLVVALGRAGFDPHLHADGDRAVRESLDAVEAMRADPNGRSVRPAIAHDEVTDPADYPRFRALGALPVMSYQWGKLGPDSLDGAKDVLGPDRFSRMEPEGSLYAAGARIAFGSDWPVDRLDEWFDLKVAMTRTGDGTLGPAYDGVFNAEKGLPLDEVIRSATLDSAYELHQDKVTGSIEVGKFADLIVLDRDLRAISPDELARIKVLLTMVGGREVWRSADFPDRRVK